MLKINISGSLFYSDLSLGYSEFFSFDFDTFVLIICKHDLGDDNCDVVGLSTLVVKEMGAGTLAEWRKVVTTVRVALCFFTDNFSNKLRVENVVAISQKWPNHIDNLQGVHIVPETV